jgi:hypothetical protein
LSDGLREKNHTARLSSGDLRVGGSAQTFTIIG